MASSKKLQKAKATKNDEFYTRLEDIEQECANYIPYFKGKTVLCNCDDPRISQFFHYFAYNFEFLGLKKLITTCYKNTNPNLFTQYKSEKAVFLEYTGDKDGNKIPDSSEIEVIELKGDGDFRSEECIELLKQADIVCTNPPFSLFREYLAQLIEYKKDFLIIGNKNAISYKQTFKLIKENKIWPGVRGFSGGMWFTVSPDSNNFDRITDKGEKQKNVPAIWLTNIDHKKRHQELILYKTYKGNESDFPQYDNYEAINVNKTCDIPIDYEGIMGVPISFLDKYNPEQFEIIWTTDRGGDGQLDFIKIPHTRYDAPVINGKGIYKRILIRRKKEIL